MVHLTINRQEIEVPEGTTILKAAEKANINIQTLCYHPDQKIKAVCRICCVEVEGIQGLPTACNTPVSEGMVVYTASPKVLKARRNILEMIFARHPQNCLVCQKNGDCELQRAAEQVNMHLDIPYDIKPRGIPDDFSSPSISRSPDKCILCGRCLEMCNDIQQMNILSKENRGYETAVIPAYGEKLVDTPCINCGQCIQVCPTGALFVHNDTDDFYHNQDIGKIMICQVAPSVRVTLAEGLGEEPGTISTGRLVTALKMLGFDKVFDSDFSADLTIMEEGSELLHRIKNGGTLPMLTSCCPGWVKYLETFAPELREHLSTAKSPQQMFGAMIKTYFAEKNSIAPEDIYSVSIMPCTAKKFECRRDEMNSSSHRDVDLSLSVIELMGMIKTAGIDFRSIPETAFDDPFGTGSGAGVIFGATGGVMEAALRTVYAIVSGSEMADIEFTPVRGFEGIKEAKVTIADTEIKLAVAHGIKNAKIIIDKIRKGEADYHFIEVMACPGGCIGGGGTPKKTWEQMQERKRAIYEADRKLPIRLSHENPAIRKIYQEFLKEPLSDLSHKYLHTAYIDRSDLIK